MCELTERLNRTWFWLAVLAVALTVWGLTDVRHRAKTDPAHPGNHRSDFTVYTTAGAAMFDGSDPYAVTNVRGWHYLYPPLFAILVAPLAKLDSQWQGVIWYAISILTAWGCFTESRRIWRWLCTKSDLPNSSSEAGPKPTNAIRTTPAYIFWLAGATVLLPALNCLQRGQVGILLTYLLLLGFRCVVTSRTVRGAVLGGVVLALPVVIKVIPALPVGFLCLLLLTIATLRRWPAAEMRRSLGTSVGVVAGLLLFVLVLPSLAIGPSANVKHLNTWFNDVLLNKQGKSDDDFSVHTLRNQSFDNAAYRLGNWTAHVIDGGKDDQLIDTPANREAEMPMDNAWAQWILRLIQLGLLALLFKAGWTAARNDDWLAAATVFALSCLLMSAISPVFRGHYYILWLPAAWLVPLYCWRSGRADLGTALAIAGCALVWMHYLLLPWAGRVGVLGLGAAVWYVVAVATIIRTKPLIAQSLHTNAPRLQQAA
jgi:hypothetical protein